MFRLIGFDARSSAVMPQPPFDGISASIGGRVREVLSFDDRISRPLVSPPDAGVEALCCHPVSGDLYQVGNAWTDPDRLAAHVARAMACSRPADDSNEELVFPQTSHLYLLAFSVVEEANQSSISPWPALAEPPGFTLEHLGFCLASWDGFDLIWDMRYSTEEYAKMKSHVPCLNRFGLFERHEHASLARQVLPMSHDDSHFPSFIIHLAKVTLKKVTLPR